MSRTTYYIRGLMHGVVLGGALTSAALGMWMMAGVSGAISAFFMWRYSTWADADDQVTE